MLLDNLLINNTVEVLDAIMGSGKTLGIINWMLDNPNNRYLYVSPMLSEVEDRIPKDCAALEFTFPIAGGDYKTKSSHLLHLLNKGHNIAFTHSLFTDLSKPHLDMIARWGYVLIIDEEVNLIEPYQGRYKIGDITSLEKAKHIRIDEDNLGMVEWLWDDMEDNTQYSSLKRLCEIKMLYCSKRSRDMMVIQLPLALVQSSRRTIVLSYLFKGSVMESFLRLKGLEVRDFTEATLKYKPEDIISKAKDLIAFKQTPSTKAVSGFGLSSTWYSVTANKKQLDTVGKALWSVYRKVGKDSLLITLPKDSTLKTVNGRKNIKCCIPSRMSADDVFLYCGARATNDYASRSVVVHGYNRYVNLVVKAYLQDYGEVLECIPSDDQFALSEMVQWVWRTCIRNSEPIDVYILSPRMERLLKSWLEEASN